MLHHVIKEFPYYDEKDREAAEGVKLSFNDFSHLCMINPGIKVSPFFAMGMTVLLFQFLAIYILRNGCVARHSATLCIRFTFRSVGGARNRSSYFVL